MWQSSMLLTKINTGVHVLMFARGPGAAARPPAGCIFHLESLQLKGLITSSAGQTTVSMLAADTVLLLFSGLKTREAG